ncbi:tumor necrosis factor receptor superfamily member 25 [Hyla sarda]|uniref:tumor necrosis factor receptor superfamily member 25 n=1 Tax=Hyla sarda TaxID=327740 RepID=UPI0024C235C3|nr:tumor necrosis factor receptor superfamily member 25 [Hyla sarda]
MKPFLCVLLLGWVHFTESVIHKNIDTLERSNERVNFSNGEINRPIRSLQRHKRSNCGTEMYYNYEDEHCCKMCPIGHYKEKPCSAPEQDSVCKPCVAGTFLAHINYVTECRRCTRCDPDTQVEVVRCSADRNSQCACKEGYYLSADHCILCTKCHNRSVTKNCSSTNNAQCGGCLPGYYEEQDECRPSCDQIGEKCENTNTSCSPVCEPVTFEEKSAPYMWIGGFLLLLVPFGGLFIYKHMRRKKHNRGEHIITVHGEGDLPGLSDVNQETRIIFSDDPGHVPSVLQKSCALYDIINCVPVRRWKEFMRTLELPDNVIEMVEVEIPNYRDQQYEMLRRWCQLKMASIDAVYQTLERMNLSRCAEELKAKIEHYPESI